MLVEIYREQDSGVKVVQDYKINLRNCLCRRDFDHLHGKSVPEDELCSAFYVCWMLLE